MIIVVVQFVSGKVS